MAACARQSHSRACIYTCLHACVCMYTKYAMRGSDEHWQLPVPSTSCPISWRCGLRPRRQLEPLAASNPANVFVPRRGATTSSHMPAEGEGRARRLPRDVKEMTRDTVRESGPVFCRVIRCRAGARGVVLSVICQVTAQGRKQHSPGLVSFSTSTGRPGPGE